MRLLSTRRIEVIEAFGSNIPRYAILSHTWGDGEVLLQDLQALEGLPDWPREALEVEPDNVSQLSSVFNKKGFSKLQQSTALARRNGFDYIWLDTCCIDKTSSAELSEAINSMHQWYQGADVCYAYLNDVKPAGTEDPMHPRSSFRQSRWFTRGWTLQELIAPRQVEFLTGDWSYLGNKNESSAFTNLLHEITGVQHGVLTGEDSLADISIASRMRWAAFRETTRVEDIAYCLLGLFDVNMPLLYGEGTKAFIRLQEAILLKDDDQSLFAWYTDDGPDELDGVGAVGTVSKLSSQLSGLLADSPQRFWATDDTETAMPLSFTGEPAAVTSRGLKVDLFLLPCTDVQGADYEAILSCERQKNAGKSKSREAPVIYLKWIWGMGDNFARVRTDLKKFTSLDVSLFQETGFYKSVFVKQNPSSDLRVIRIAAAPDNSQLQLPGRHKSELQGTDLVWRVKEAYPRHAWNKEAQCFETRDIVLDLPAAVLRIEVEFAGGAPLLLDVAVGMGVRNQRTCKSWCQIIYSGVLHLDIEESWNVAVREARLQSFNLAELSTRNIFNISMLTWAVVTERNRKKGVEISLHVVSNGSSRSKEAPEDGVLGGVTKSDGRFGSIEVISADELQELGVPVFDYRPSTRNMKHEGFWDIEVQSLLQDFCVEDSVEISVFQRVDLGGKVRRIAAAWGKEETSLSLELLKYCENSLSSLDGAAARHTAGTLCSNNVEEARAFLESARRPDGVPEPFLQLRPIHWAVMGQNVDIVRMVLEAGADPLGPSASRLTSLHLAAMIGGEAITDLLFNRLYPIYLEDKTEGNGRGHARPTAEIGDYPSHFAAAYATTSDFWAAYEDRFWNLCGPSRTNFLGETPLHRAAAMRNVAAVRFMTHPDNIGHVGHPWPVETSDYVNAVDNMGRTALWHAACVDSDHVVQALVNAGADVHLPDDLGLTPAHVASREDNGISLLRLIEAGADLNRQAGSLHLKPAHMAAIFGATRSMGVLMAENPDIISELDDGTSLNAFHFAVANGNEECAKAIWNHQKNKKDMEFRDWSLCVIIGTTGPMLRWMGVYINQNNWAIMENPDQDRAGLIGSIMP